MLQRASISRDASGGALKVFLPLAGVQCAVLPASAKVMADYARLDMLVDHHLFTTADLDAPPINGVKAGDRFVDGSILYLVKTVLKSANAQVSGEALYQVECERRIF